MSLVRFVVAPLGKHAERPLNSAEVQGFSFFRFPFGGIGAPRPGIRRYFQTAPCIRLPYGNETGSGGTGRQRSFLQMPPLVQRHPELSEKIRGAEPEIFSGRTFFINFFGYICSGQCKNGIESTSPKHTRPVFVYTKSV